MIRQPEREQLNRLTAKTLDQVFVMRVKEGLGCSQFGAEALTDLVKEIYFPWLAQPEAIQTVHLGYELGLPCGEDQRGMFQELHQRLQESSARRAIHDAVINRQAEHHL